MTSNTAAGFRRPTASADPLADYASRQAAAPPLEKKSDKSPEEACQELERRVSAFVEESASLAVAGDTAGALEKAKEASKRERALCKRREELGLSEQINIDLTYAVHLNLALAFQRSKLFTDALNTYSLIVRNKQYSLAGRLRANMGNIYFEERKYPLALKMYRLALSLDNIPPSGKDVRLKVMRNIGHALVRMGQYAEAIQSYEAIMDGRPDISTALNLLLCYHAIGDKERLKRQFARMLNIPAAFSSDTAGVGDDEDDDPPLDMSPSPGGTGEGGGAPGTRGGGMLGDELQLLLRERRQRHAAALLIAARLVAPQIEKDWAAGYDYVIDALRQQKLARLSSEVEMCKAVGHLRHKRVVKAIEALKAFERKDKALRARAATNLSYVYFLEGDAEAGIKYADMAISEDRCNVRGLVNRGNFDFAAGAYDKAAMRYLEAVRIEGDCVEARYNLGLTFKAQGALKEAAAQFKRVHTLVPDAVEGIYQLANVADLMGEKAAAIEWFDRLKARVPSDPGVLARLGYLHAQADDDSTALYYFVEAYRYLPVNLAVIQWLGAHFIRMEVYEKAMVFFERAAQIQPMEPKWPIMVGSCFRRLGQYPAAKRLYEEVARRHPENTEVLKYLVHVCNDTGYKDEAVAWHRRLKRLTAQQRGETVPDEEPAGGQSAERVAADVAELLAATAEKRDAGVEGAGGAVVEKKKVSKAEARANARKEQERKEAEEDDVDLSAMLPS